MVFFIKKHRPFSWAVNPLLWAANLRFLCAASGQFFHALLNAFFEFCKPFMEVGNCTRRVRLGYPSTALFSNDEHVTLSLNLEWCN